MSLHDRGVAIKSLASVTIGVLVVVAMTRDDDPQPTVTDPPIPESSIDWGVSRLTPRFLAALAAGQAALKTEDKAAWQDQQRYNYATADAVIGQVRRAFAPQGISLVTSFRQWAPAEFTRVKESSQWIDWHVRLDWALLFGVADYGAVQPATEDGPRELRVAGEIGLLVGWAQTVAIGSKGRPPDKSLYAARTSLSGYIALGVSALDRAIVPKSDDIDQRDDSKGASDAPSEEVLNLRDEIDTAMRTIKQGRRAAGLPDLSPVALVELVNGEPFRAGREGWLSLYERANDYVTNLQARVDAEIDSMTEPRGEDAP